MIRAVTFDFWQTLVSERRGHMRDLQIDRWCMRLTEAGQPRARADLEAAFTENWAVFEERWRANDGQWGAAETVDFVGARLGLVFDDGLRERLIDGFRIVGETAELTLAPGLPDVLARLRGEGIRMGIVCDVGLTGGQTLRRRLEGFGVLEAFDAWAFSDETGWFKPSARAFAPALDGLGVAPEDAAHVGDNERTDIAGAKGLGMMAVQYTGLNAIGAWLPEQEPGALADHVIDDMAALPRILGL
jgi:putative hydrolase of the HAD superfamily